MQQNDGNQMRVEANTGMQISKTDTDMEVQIFKMSTDDVDRVVEIEQECFSMPWTKQSFLEALKQNNAFYYVAKYGAEIVGHCGAYGVCGEGSINQVAVTNEYRRCGIARQMVSTMMEEMKKHGFLEITLEVRVGNTSAIALYESLGFVQEGIRKNFYEKPTEDAIIMWKR